MRKNNALPAARCTLGYPADQIREILQDGHSEEFADFQVKKFNKWMIGQTTAVCDGRQYNYDMKEYEATHCGPHGSVVYPWDLARFLAGRPVID